MAKTGITACEQRCIRSRIVTLARGSWQSLCGRIRRLEVFLVEFLVRQSIGRVAQIIPGLDYMRQIAAGIMQDLDEILHRTAEFLLERAGNNLPGIIHRGLAGDKISSP